METNDQSELQKRRTVNFCSYRHFDNCRCAPLRIVDSQRDTLDGRESPSNNCHRLVVATCADISPLYRPISKCVQCILKQTAISKVKQTQIQQTWPFSLNHHIPS